MEQIYPWGRVGCRNVPLAQRNQRVDLSGIFQTFVSKHWQINRRVYKTINGDKKEDYGWKNVCRKKQIINESNFSKNTLFAICKRTSATRCAIIVFLRHFNNWISPAWSTTYSDSLFAISIFTMNYKGKAVYFLWSVMKGSLSKSSIYLNAACCSQRSLALFTVICMTIPSFFFTVISKL